MLYDLQQVDSNRNGSVARVIGSEERLVKISFRVLNSP
jgi:hypothetical protein